MAEYRKEKYIKDLFIQGDDGQLYYLTEKEWKKRPVDGDKLHEEVKIAIKLGSVVATLPEKPDYPKSSPEFDSDDNPIQLLGACFLLNIETLKIPH